MSTFNNPEYDADDATPGDPPGVGVASSDDEYDLREYRQSVGDLSSEYGEIEDHAKPSRSEHALQQGFYKKSVRRQNCFFGISLLHIFAAFVGAYFLMGMSFTRSNIGTFGDESAMEGSSGEVGIDADNAEIQEIIDEEIVELEEAGDWGDNAKRVDSNQRFKDLVKIRDKHEGVGKNKWTEQKKWWEENKDHLDESKMSKAEKRIADRFKKKEEKQKQHEEKKKKQMEDRKRKKKKHAKAQKDGGENDSTTVDEPENNSATADEADIDLITEHITEHYNFTDPHSGRPGSKRDKNRPKGSGPGGNKANKEQAKTGFNPVSNPARAKANKEQANSDSNQVNNPTRAKANKEQKVNDYNG